MMLSKAVYDDNPAIAEAEDKEVNFHTIIVDGERLHVYTHKPSAKLGQRSSLAQMGLKP